MPRVQGGLGSSADSVVRVAGDAALNDGPDAPDGADDYGADVGDVAGGDADTADVGSVAGGADEADGGYGNGGDNDFWRRLVVVVADADVIVP